MTVIQEVKGQKTITLPKNVCDVKGWKKGMKLYVAMHPETKDVYLVDGFDVMVNKRSRDKVKK